MACPSCIQVTGHLDIRGPGELRKVKSYIERLITDGVLVESKISEFSEPFSTLPRDGMMPDYISNSFSCLGCGQTFKLEVETYHGAGGSFRRMVANE
jgi:hypothetical protein